MSEEQRSLTDIKADEISDCIRSSGVAGAGGAGFPTYVKWSDLDDVNYFLMNHQESEPNYYADKWLGQTYAEDFSELFDFLLEEVFDVVVVGTKERYEGQWLSELKKSTDGTVYEPEDLPLDIENESGVVIVKTPNVYTYSEEAALLMVTAGVQIQDDLPTEHGWIVQNTESVHNIYRALSSKDPVTRKFVHIDGNAPKHRCLEVPIGTTGMELLEAAGLNPDSLADDQVLADGGPGWCYEIDLAPEKFGVRKRTNGLLVLTRKTVDENSQDEGQIDILEALDWSEKDDHPHEKEPHAITPELVRIPLITNAAYKGFVHSSIPYVDVGDDVTEGEVIAEPSGDGISIPQHASIEGTVTEITDTHIIIEKN